MIFVTGNGQIGCILRTVLQESLGQYAVSSITTLATPVPDDLVVACSDSYVLDWLRYWERMCAQWKIPFIGIHVHNGEAIIGPYIYPNKAGCLQCWHKRYYSGRMNARKFSEGLSIPEEPPRSDPWITNTSAFVVAEIAARRILDLMESCSRRETSSRSVFYAFDLRKLTGKEWRFLPDSSCSCAKCPFDSPNMAYLTVGSRVKAEAHGDRVRDVGDLTHVVNETYVGPGGIVSGVTVSWPFHPGAVALTGVDLLGLGRLEVCGGQSNRYSSARTIAVIEALERYTSALPRGRRVAIRATAGSLGGLAVSPRLFGLYSEDQYENNPEMLTRYSDELEMDFVWAFSWQRLQPVLIPRHLGFYAVIGAEHEAAFVMEGSNGCAIGACPEEAIFHGLLEVIERDALLLTWYSRRTPPRVNVMSGSDAETRCRARLLEEQGFRLEAFDITTEFGIPTILCLALRSDDAMPSAVCVPASHLYPQLAFRKAMRELCAMADRLRIELADTRIRSRIHELAEDVTLARNALDHPLCYCSPISRSHFDFLLQNQEEISEQDFSARAQDLWSHDLGVELQRLIQRVLAHDLDVIVVNHTCPEQTLAGLCNYKVLVPGTVPMAWGAHLQRFESIPRFQTMLNNNIPNPAPHPFA